MSGIIGLDGRELVADNGHVEDPEARAAEEAGKAVKDVDSTDELGVRYFYALDHQNSEKRGQRIPERERKKLRQHVKRQHAQFEFHMKQPTPRHEVEALFQNSIAPLGRQIQSVTFQFTALRNLIAAKLGITEADILQETAKVIDKYREDSKEQAVAMKQKALDEMEQMAHGVHQSEG